MHVCGQAWSLQLWCNELARCSKADVPLASGALFCLLHLRLVQGLLCWPESAVAPASWVQGCVVIAWHSCSVRMHRWLQSWGPSPSLCTFLFCLALLLISRTLKADCSSKQAEACMIFRVLAIWVQVCEGLVQQQGGRG